MSVSKNARVAALKIVLAHFPNVPFLMRDIERTYEPDVVRDLPKAMSALRAQLESDLRQASLASDAADSLSTTKV